MDNIEDMIPLIRQVIKEEVSQRLDQLEQKINEIVLLRSTVNKCEAKLNEFERSVEFSGSQINDLIQETIPSLETKFKEMTETVCTKILDIDVHRRKWSLIISGLSGQEREQETNTRAKVKMFASEKLKIDDAEAHQMAACHRLNQNKDAPVIARFVDLDHRNKWLSSAKNLKGSNENISITPDIPPVLRPLKIDILQQRKALPAAQKSTSTVKYLPRWPYISLSIKGQPTKYSSISQETIMKNYLGL